MLVCACADSFDSFRHILFLRRQLVDRDHVVLVVDGGEGSLRGRLDRLHHLEDAIGGSLRVLLGDATD